MIQATRYHDISCGHRVVGHESKCRYLHGHNYRVHFYCAAEQLDSIGRVIDFSVIKERLCMWLEDTWDHKTLLSSDDPACPSLLSALADSFVLVPFNPTAENMGQYLLDVVGPAQLEGTGVVLTKVVIEETRKCSAIIEKG